MRSIFPSRTLVTPIRPESVLRNYVRPKLRPAELGWINFAVLRRSHSTLHKQRNSDLKIIADQQGHGMRTHLDSYVQSAVAERKAEAAKLYADFTGVLNKVNRGRRFWVRPCKLLILWSGRRDSNPRRPAWEYALPLKIENLCVQGDQFWQLATIQFQQLPCEPSLNAVIAVTGATCFSRP